MADLVDAAPSQVRGEHITERQKAEELLLYSELRYKSLFECNLDAVFSFDKEGRFTSANPACERITGYSSAELLNQTFVPLLAEHDLPRALEHFQLVVEGEPQNLELTIISKDGRAVEVAMSAMPILLDGSVRGVFGIARDITAQKQTERELRVSEERLRIAMEAGRMGAWEWHIDTGAVTWSEGIELIHGLLPGTFDGTFESFARDMHADDRTRVLEEIKASVQRGSLDLDYRIIHPDGRTRWLMSKGQTLYDELGAPRRMIGVCMDITETKEAEEYLRRANEFKDEFLGLISHELRTPITTIYGGARLLRSRGEMLDDESKGAMLSDIEQEAERLHRIVEDLLVLSRLQLDEGVPTEPVLVHHVVEKVAATHRQRRPYRLIECNINEGLPSVAAEPTYLEQVLRNLLSNADKYSPADKPIEITAARSDADRVRISVLDRGGGIPLEDADRIFERFYRAPNSSKHVGGAGIGLTVCKRLIEAQSGRIWACRREGGGLEVSFTLPVFREELG